MREVIAFGEMVLFMAVTAGCCLFLGALLRSVSTGSSRRPIG